MLLQSAALRMMMMMTDSSLSSPNRAPEERRIKICLMLFEGTGVIKNSCFCLHVAAAVSDPLVVVAASSSSSSAKYNSFYIQDLNIEKKNKIVIVWGLKTSELL